MKKAIQSIYCYCAETVLCQLDKGIVVTALHQSLSAGLLVVSGAPFHTHVLVPSFGSLTWPTVAIVVVRDVRRIPRAFRIIVYMIYGKQVG